MGNNLDKPILLMSNHSLTQLPLHEALTEIPAKNRILFCSYKVSDEEVKLYDKQYSQIKRFENYPLSSEVEYAIWKLSQNIDLKLIVTQSELDILRAANFRELLNIPGQNLNSALTFRNKLLMKNLASQHGIKVPIHGKVNCALDILKFTKTNGFPIVIKPIDGVASQKTYLIKDELQLLTLLQSVEFSKLLHDRAMLIEAFIKGNMYCVDGVISNDELIAIWPFRYVDQCINLSKGNWFGCHLLEAENPLTERLISYCRSLLKKFPTPSNTGFHLEIFHTENDEFIFCEIASRVGSGMIDGVWQAAFGNNITFEAIRAQAMLPYLNNVADQKPKMTPGFILLPAKGGIPTRLPRECPFEWVKDFSLDATEGVYHKPTQDLSDIMGKALFLSKSEKDYFDKLREFLSWYESEVIWA